MGLGRVRPLGNSDTEKAVGMRPVPPGNPGGAVPAAPKALGARTSGRSSKRSKCARSGQALPLPTGPWQ